MSKAEASAIGRVDDLDYPAGRPTGQQFENLEVLERNDHPLVPSISHDYWERNLGDGVTDLEAVTHSMESSNFCTLLEGETGTGKNTLIDFVCQETNRPRVRVNFGVDVTYEELVGHYSPDGEGDFEWQDGTLTWAVKYGAVFIADELNGAEGEALIPLNGVAESYDRRELVIRKTGEILKPFPEDEEWDPEEHLGEYIHPEFKFVATMNPLGYAGTKDLNQAFKNRFHNIPIPYLGKDEEVEFLDDQTSLGPVRAQNLVKLANKLRQQHGENIQTAISTRDLMKVAEFNEIMPLPEAAHMVLVGQAKHNDKSIISGVIDKNDL